MIVTLEELVRLVDSQGDPTDTRASDALWILFDKAKTHKTMEYRSASGNELLHVYLDENGALLGLEIFP